MAARKKITKPTDRLYNLLQSEDGKKGFAQLVCEALGSDGCEWLERKLSGPPLELTAKEKALAECFEIEVLDEQENKAIEIASLFEYYRFRAQLLSDSLSASEAAKLLNVSRETVHERVRSGKMLGILENGLLRLPLCQFDGAGPGGLITGFQDVLAALKCTDFEKLSWLTNPSRFFEGRTPVQALRDGERSDVLIQAIAVGVT